MHVRSRIIGVVLAAATMAACNSSQSPGASTGAAYELVLVQKPDSIEAYASRDRRLYDLCVTTAQLGHQAVKPFPALPASLGTTRKTYLIRGADRMVREEQLAVLDASKDAPDTQCEIDVVTHRGPDVDLLVGATHTTIGTGEDGHSTTQTEDISDLRQAQGASAVESTARYTQASTLNGIDLRCLPEGKPPLDGNQMQQMCVYARDGVLVEADGKAIVLASRVKPTPNYPVVTITEPQSLRTLEHPEESSFDPASYTR